MTPSLSNSRSASRRLFFPTRLGFDKNGNLWVVDNNNNRFEEFSISGTTGTFIRSYANGTLAKTSPAIHPPAQVQHPGRHCHQQPLHT